MANEIKGQTVKMWKDMDKDFSLRYQLGRLTKDDLKEIVKSYEIKGVSKLKKDELIETIIVNILNKISTTLETISDDNKNLIKNIINASGILDFNENINIDDVIELRNKAILFTGKIENKETLIITEEVKNILVGLLVECNEECKKDSSIVTNEEVKADEQLEIDKELINITNQINEMQKVENMRMIMNALSRKNKDKENNKKVGRNDLCPCGSGKKYKKCCLGK
ncbi:SEC-C metal-binding domain-containing protein [Clostridium fallax]|uniref:Rho termination factor, N-terminal domain n=1 Tax=Clostridium fallax TaxID=1533 RepID=A0A1M4SXW1_9CLOT|nr:SEC-C metal-binding domain-containing protein [Clostridium fallax]SHE37048.1 Rho termination factor, N-terminal domain [Clostridium fallax]SQB08024.1 protein translocase subunit secA [Clostridium fallax]